MAYTITDKLKKITSGAIYNGKKATSKNFPNVKNYNPGSVRLSGSTVSGRSGTALNPGSGGNYSGGNIRTYTAAQRQPVRYDGNNVSVRAQMNNMGLDNSKIGWDNGYVTYDNFRFKPSSVKDGVSYAPISDVNEVVDQVYKSQGKDPVRITDYVSPAGLDGISYSANGRVAVGGENIPVLYMDGDRAVVNRSDLDAAYEKLLNRTGVKTTQQLYDGWNSRYGNAVDKAYSDMAGYGAWSYNPETDPAYQAYKNMYEREGERAYRDAAAKLASKNNGNMTSAAQTVANSQLAYYMSMLADRIPELQKNSYDRYKNGYDMKRQNYEALKARADSDWSRQNEINNTAKSDYKNWQDYERQRTVNAQDDALYAQNYRMNDLNAEAKQDEITRNRNASEQEILDYAWKNAENRGYFTRAEAELLNIPQDENGNYLTPNEIKIRNDIQYFNEATKPQLQFKNDLDWENTSRELGAKYGYEGDLQASGYAQKNALSAANASRSLSNSKALAKYRYDIYHLSDSSKSSDSSKKSGSKSSSDSSSKTSSESKTSGAAQPSTSRDSKSLKKSKNTKNTKVRIKASKTGGAGSASSSGGSR